MVSHPETGSDSPIGSDLDRGRDSKTPEKLKFSKSIKLNNKFLKWLREA